MAAHSQRTLTSMHGLNLIVEYDSRMGYYYAIRTTARRVLSLPARQWEQIVRAEIETKTQIINSDLPEYFIVSWLFQIHTELRKVEA